MRPHCAKRHTRYLCTRARESTPRVSEAYIYTQHENLINEAYNSQRRSTKIPVHACEAGESAPRALKAAP